MSDRLAKQRRTMPEFEDTSYDVFEWLLETNPVELMHIARELEATLAEVREAIEAEDACDIGAEYLAGHIESILDGEGSS